MRLIVTALANTYRAEHSDDIDDLLECAHLLYERAGEIREAKVTGDADPRAVQENDGVRNGQLLRLRRQRLGGVQNDAGAPQRRYRGEPLGDEQG